MQRLAALIYPARKWWSGLDLSHQFTIATSVIVIVGMLIIGRWVTTRITDGVIQSAAADAVLYTDSFINPLIQELATGSSLSAENQTALDTLLQPQSAGQPIVGFIIWQGDTIIHSNRREMIGRVFPPSNSRQRAWSGHVTSGYGRLDDPEHDPSGGSSTPILEIYAPVRQMGSGRIIALAETYRVIPKLTDELTEARIGSWLVIVAITLHMLALQFVIVREGSRTIEQQRRALNNQISDLSTLLRENERLRRRAATANRSVSELNERFLHRIAADLHDGPVQLVATAILRLDALGDAVADADQAIVDETRNEIAILHETLREAMDEIRNLSAGLAPPEIEKLSLAAMLESLARRHERRTGTPVRCALDILPDQVPFAIKACLYRFAQEGLNNAFRHGNGVDQAITADFDGDCLEISVLDAGPGFQRQAPATENGGRGLLGLRHRIESLGGTLDIGARAEGGTHLAARFQVSQSRIEMEAAGV